MSDEKNIKKETVDKANTGAAKKTANASASASSATKAKAAGAKSASATGEKKAAGEKKNVRTIIFSILAIVLALAIAIPYKISTDRKKAEEARIEALEKAADAVEAKIDGIGEVTLESEPAITTARTAYDGASESVQEKVANYPTLTKAEEDYSALVAKDKADAEAAKAVEDKIKAVGMVTAESSDAINAARSAYDSLSDEAKAKVGNAGTLTEDESALITAQAEAQKAKEQAEAEEAAKQAAEAAQSASTNTASASKPSKSGKSSTKSSTGKSSTSAKRGTTGSTGGSTGSGSSDSEGYTAATDPFLQEIGVSPDEIRSGQEALDGLAAKYGENGATIGN